MTLIINPGSGPVGGTAETARANVDALVRDAGVAGVDVVALGPGVEGRFRFDLSAQGGFCEVDMPGLALERVRYLGEPGQSIFEFPRLYVNGSSWVWSIAVGFVGDALRG